MKIYLGLPEAEIYLPRLLHFTWLYVVFPNNDYCQVCLFESNYSRDNCITFFSKQDKSNIKIWKSTREPIPISEIPSELKEVTIKAIKYWNLESKRKAYHEKCCLLPY